jgi:hypothetical protein
VSAGQIARVSPAFLAAFPNAAHRRVVALSSFPLQGWENAIIRHSNAAHISRADAETHFRA